MSTLTINHVIYKTIGTNSAEVSGIDDKNHTNAIEIQSKITIDNVEYVVTTVGNDAFYLCRSITSISLPNTLKYICFRAFDTCARVSGTLDIPNGVETIGIYAFASMSVEYFRIPKSVTKIEEGAFCNNLRLKGFYVDFENMNYSNDMMKSLYNKNQTIIYQYVISKKKLVLAPTVVRLGYKSCLGGNFNKIILPKGVVYFGHRCISSITIKELHITADWLVGDDGAFLLSSDASIYYYGKMAIDNKVMFSQYKIIVSHNYPSDSFSTYKVDEVRTLKMPTHATCNVKRKDSSSFNMLCIVILIKS